MKIAIVGMGLSGSYLSSRLSTEHKIVGYDLHTKDNFDAVCGWGSVKDILEKYASVCGLKFEDYVVHNGKKMIVDVNGEIIDIKLNGLCCFDKKRFIQDMINGKEVIYGKYVNKEILKEDYDIIIDSTGLIRPLLPKIENDLLIPCVQYRVRFKNPPYDDFYIKTFKGLTGYFWYFPLGDGIFHVGAGDYLRRHNDELSTFLNKHPCEILKKNGRPVRITPPILCEPFFDGKVVGVGESIGTVYPMLGEGIIPSLQCADLLIGNLNNFQKYRDSVLEHFRIHYPVYRFIKSKIEGKFILPLQLISLIRIYRYMKINESRYGMDINIRNLLKIVLKA